MASVIGDLLVRVGADTKEFNSKMRRTQRQLAQLGKETRQQANEFGRYAAGAAAAGTALAVAFTAKAAEAGREMRTFLEVSKASASEFQTLAHAAREVGIENDKLADILKDVNDRVGDFLTTGGGPMADFFEKIAPAVGVTAEQFQKLSGPQALQLYIDSLEKANLSQAEMTFFLEAMASDATALLPILQDGGAALAKQAEEVEKLGIAMSDIEVDRLAMLSDGFKKSVGVVDSFTDQVVAELTPALLGINEQFLEMVKNVGGAGTAAENTANVIIDASGFILDAIEGVKRTFEVLGKTVALIGLGMKETFLAIAETILNRPIQAVNEFIEVLNQLPTIDIEPVGLPEWGEKAREEMELTRQAIALGIEDIHNTLMAPMPSTQLDDFVAKVQETVDAEAEILANHREEKLVAQQEFDTLLNQMIADGEQIRLQTMADAAAAEGRIQQQRTRDRANAEKKMWSDLTSLMGSESRKMFEVGKVAAISETIISTIKGAQDSYSALAGIPVVGPALGTAAAAAAIAAGFVRVNAIRSTQFGSKSAGGVAAGGNPVAGGAGVPSGGGVAGGGGSGQNVFIEGIDRDSLYTGDQLVDLINTAQENGARLVLL